MTTSASYSGILKNVNCFDLTLHYCPPSGSCPVFAKKIEIYDKMEKVDIEPATAPNLGDCEEIQHSLGKGVTLANADNGNNDEETQHLSKRALKKLRKRQEWLDSKPERRKKEKEKRRLKMATRKQNKDYEESRTASRKSLKEVKMSQSSCSVCVVFDMQFGHLMTERDLGKCLKQITRCYRLV